MATSPAAPTCCGAPCTRREQANSDSFHFTNITPQMAGFNQSGRGGTWGLLENAVLALEGLEDRRLTLFAGPVLDPADPPYRGIVQLPSSTGRSSSTGSKGS